MSRESTPRDEEIPNCLVESVLRGECVAFVGAGFSGEHLRAQAPTWWSDRFWGDPAPAPMLKLHGDVERPQSIVLSRRGYRRNLYRDPGYQAFLRSLFAQQTVLFLGFSFSDAYLNGLRSEALALFGYARANRPVAYALVNDAPDFSKFDALLEDLHKKTNPIRRFAKALKDKRILWIDPHPSNNDDERRFMEERSSADGRPGATFIEEPNIEAAKARFEQGERFDLVITHWGEAHPQDEDRRTMAERVLQQVRSLGAEGCPVIPHDEVASVHCRAG